MTKRLTICPRYTDYTSAAKAKEAFLSGADFTSLAMGSNDPLSEIHTTRDLRSPSDVRRVAVPHRARCGRRLPRENRITSKGAPDPQAASPTPPNVPAAAS
jgi:hypothetical protein